MKLKGALVLSRDRALLVALGWVDGRLCEGWAVAHDSGVGLWRIATSTGRGGILKKAQTHFYNKGSIMKMS